MDELSQELKQVDDKVERYRTTFEKTTNEAQRLKVDLEKAKETIEAAQNLVGKLEGEFYRYVHSFFSFEFKSFLFIQMVSPSQRSQRSIESFT